MNSDFTLALSIPDETNSNTFVVSTYGARHPWGLNLLRCFNYIFIISILNSFFLPRSLKLAEHWREGKCRYCSEVSYLKYINLAWWQRWREWLVLPSLGTASCLALVRENHLCDYKWGICLTKFLNKCKHI